MLSHNRLSQSHFWAGRFALDALAVNCHTAGSPACLVAITGHFRCLSTDILTSRAVEGNDVQAALTELTGRRTVPQVFLKGEFIGGCDGKYTASSARHNMHVRMTMACTCCLYTLRCFHGIAAILLMLLLEDDMKSQGQLCCCRHDGSVQQWRASEEIH